MELCPPSRSAGLLVAISNLTGCWRRMRMRLASISISTYHRSFRSHRLLAQDEHGRSPVRLLLVDNRGVGRSSSPLAPTAYTTSRMAEDILQIMVGSVGHDQQDMQNETSNHDRSYLRLGVGVLKYW